jgi:hypothetical protein
MRVLVTGKAKSGTSALFSALLQSLPAGYQYLFEPRSYQGDGGPDVLIKTIIGRCDVPAFDKQILIVRDPRDALISLLLYCVYDLERIWGNNYNASAWVMAIWGKERNPFSASVHALIYQMEALCGRPQLQTWLNDHLRSILWHIERPDAFVIRYEDFVAGNWGGTEDYLGIPLAFDGEVFPPVKRVDRKREPGDWRHWFTEFDVEYFRPLFSDYMERYGYDGWDLAEEPVILPEHASRYVKRLVRERHGR